MAKSAVLSIKILSDASQASAGLDKASSRMDKFRSGIRKAAIPAALIGAAVVKFGKDAVDSASHLQQALGGVDAVFGKNAATINKWGAAAADSIGLAKSDYADLATLIGSQFKNAGLPMGQVTKKTGELIQKGADLAAMYGGTTKEAVEALSSAFKGEFDPLEKYGTSLNQTKVNAELAASGADKLTGKAASQAKAMATLKLITQQTADATGAAAREQDTAAARAQQLSANVENLKADLGTALLPIVAQVAQKLGVLAKWMAKNKTATQILIGTIGGLAAAVLVLNAAMLVLSANPVVLIIAGIVAAVIALGVALTIAYKRSATFRKIVDGAFAAVKTAAAAVVKAFRAIGTAAAKVFNWIRSHWRLLAAILFGPVGIAVAVITKHWGKIRSSASALLSWIRSAFRTTFSVVATIVRTYIAVVKAVIDGVKTAIKAVTSFLSSTWRTAWSTAATVAKTAINAIKSPVEAVKRAVDSLIGAVQSLISWLGKIKVPSLGGIAKKLNPLSATAAGPAAPAVATYGARARSGVGAPAATSAYDAGGVTININGALDPEGTARAVARVMRGHTRRVGLAT